MAPCNLLPNVERIAVLRPSAVGDFMFALPALAALQAAYPQAHLTLLGKPWHAEFLRERRGPVHRVVAIPPIRGVGAPPDAVEDHAARDRFIAEMRQCRFDLAFQLYGGGRYSNALVQQIEPRCSVGLKAPEAAALDRSLPYAYLQNERLRLLEVVALAGAQPAALDPRLELGERDLAELRRQVALPDAPLAVLQPGATDPRRCWPPEKFAAVGDALAKAGAVIAINGSPGEREVVSAVIGHMRSTAVDLCGTLSLSGLAALLARARLVVSNDTGPLHLAQAVGTPTVGIYWLTNLLVSAPLVQHRHRHVVCARVHCPACGADNLHRRCEHDPSFVADVDTEEVITLALELFEPGVTSS